MTDVTMYGPVAVRKIVREYGHPPAIIRNAIVMMRRRGEGYRATLRAIHTVNAANAHESYRMSKYPDPADIFAAIEHRSELHQLEHSLATTFVKWMFSKDPAERSQLWQSMFEIARKLKELDAD